ncbi:hypothetical protein Rhe02_08630 [Rhizocola hellebori]|uniref:Uncharacterized protein n=1 Tax=Rhizocola hellebori TaxID=1392758 RepID=A0A8J3Q3N2_9ACTN|nr:hypothetical protein [Rhizocola hellebori]GIH02796.1 hypothetical protein Rhe02_08630 [Rhizocola hellebori]
MDTGARTFDAYPNESLALNDWGYTGRTNVTDLSLSRFPTAGSITTTLDIDHLSVILG